MPKIFVKLDKLDVIYRGFYKVILLVCKILLLADILITSMSVLGRYVSFIPDPAWSEQIVLTLMTYMTVLSATLAIRDGTHIRMTALDKFLSPKLIKALDILADIAVLMLAIIMVKYGFKFAKNLGRFGSYESLPWLSRYWMYFPVPLAGIAMIIFEIEALYRHIRSFFVKGTTEVKEAQL